MTWLGIIAVVALCLFLGYPCGGDDWRDGK